MTANDQDRPVGQKRVVIVGASGMVGGYALRCALENSAVGTVTSIGRKKIGISHPKLTEVLHRDFADCSALAETLLGQNSAVFCLGTYTGSVSDADLRRITADYTIEFARVLHGSSPERGVLILERKWRGPNGTKPDALRALQGRGREGATRGGIPSRLPLPARIHLPRGAAAGTEFQLPTAAGDLSGVSVAVP